MLSSRQLATGVLGLAFFAGCDSGDPLAAGNGWPRHTIDDSSRGADGVRLGDINGDGLPDVTSPWEQGGQIRVYVNPGSAGLRDRWPAVTVGEVGDPEDSFFADLDGDGALDVVSSCEGSARSIFVHWNPNDPEQLMNPDAWKTEPLPASVGHSRWMFTYATQVDGANGIDLVASSKNKGAQIGWFEAPADPRDLAAWQWHPLYDAGWAMTLRPYDMDADGDLDIVGTDRRGPRRGALWLEHPGPSSAAGDWTEHRIGPLDDHEAMHNTIADLDQDGLDDVIVAAKGGPLRFHRRTSVGWETHQITMPPRTGSGKGVKVADVDLDGQPDLVISCEHATDGKSGLFWLSYDQSPTEPEWSFTTISGPEGFIFDLLQLVDLDGDGDLDVVTLEEKGPYLASGYEGSELGVIWYENPAKP